MARAPSSGQFKQFNVRMDAELLDAYRDYCEGQGLDPHQLVINFMEKLLREKPDFEKQLWKALTKNR